MYRLKNQIPFQGLISFAIVLFLSVNIAYPQIIKDDFEGSGSITTWIGDDCEINTSLFNPFKTGINTSSTVLEYKDKGGTYANVRFQHNKKFDLTKNSIYSLKVYVPSSGLTGSQTNQVSLKLQDGSLGEPWTTQTEIIKPILLNQWQIVTFDFKNDSYINYNQNSPTPLERTDFDRVLIQINGENNADKVLAYIDDFYYENITTPDPIYDNLIWSDEFTTNGAIDATKWHHQTLLPAGGNWFNNEVQHYTNRIENSFVENDLLKIVAKKESFTNQGVTKQYTSARLNSKIAFKYGRVEVMAKLPIGVGTWPAIWMLGKNINEDGGYWDLQGYGTKNWPACGEIDIMEHWGNNQNYISSAIHTPSSFGGTVNVGGTTVSTVSTAQHLYTLDWTPEKMVFSVDNSVYYTYNPKVKDASTWPFDAEQYLLLNIAIQSSISPSFTQSAMEIDYVRVYQAKTTSINKPQFIQNSSFYPNPISDILTIELGQTKESMVTFNVYNYNGSMVKTDKLQLINNKVTIGDWKDLPSGLYMVVYILEGRKYTLKCLKD